MIFIIYINDMKHELIEVKDGWEVNTEHCTPDGKEHLLKIFLDAYPNHEDIIKDVLSKCWEDAHLGNAQESDIQANLNNFINILENYYQC